MNKIDKNLSFYIHAFTHLNVNKSKGIAPHKPILLLSVINLYENAIQLQNCIYLTPELVGFFRSNWSVLVETGHIPQFSLPFYHLRNEKANFWRLIPNIGCELWLDSQSAMRSFQSIKIVVNYVEIDENLHYFLSNEQSRALLKTAILEAYFPNYSALRSQSSENQYFESIYEEMLTTDGETYSEKINFKKKQMSKEIYEEEIFVRSSFFKKIINRIYNNTCAISGLRVDSVADLSLIDACHIIPFSAGYDDTVTNGIALCPNLHRAFDRGIITINQNYEVVVSDCFVETINSYSIRQFHNKTILLPEKKSQYPNLKNILWHQHNIFKK